MLKEISSLLYRLPAASSPEFAEEFQGSWGGVLLASLFTEILKGTGNIHDVIVYSNCSNVQLSQKVAFTTETRRRRMGMASRIPRGKGLAQYSEPVPFDPFFSAAWDAREL